MDYADKLPPSPWYIFAPPRRYIFPPPLTPPMDYADKLPPSPWYIFAPPRRYIFPPPLTKEAPPSEMDRAAHAREKCRALLARKQLPAADIDVRVAEFQPAFDAAKDRLQALGIDETSAAILFAEARDAPQDGEYRHVVNLVCLAADKCAEESRDRRTAAQKCARTAIVARALAGELELAQLEYAAAAELFGQAAAGAPEGDEDFLAAQLEKQGSAAYLGGDHKTALAAFERALALLEGKLGPNHADVAAALNNLALAHYAQGDLDAAEPLYARALEIDEAALGPDHPGIATDLGNLALLHKKREDHAKAEPMFRRALEIVESAYTSQHPSVVKAMRNYSALLRDMSRDAEADELEKRANDRAAASRAEGASPRARGPPMDYADKLPPSPWYIFAPPRRYIFPPPLTPVSVSV